MFPYYGQSRDIKIHFALFKSTLRTYSEKWQNNANSLATQSLRGKATGTGHLASRY
jgi:hypothetical protein